MLPSIYTRGYAYIPENKEICKILEDFEITLKRPSLKKQIESKELFLFRNGFISEFHNFYLQSCIY